MTIEEAAMEKYPFATTPPHDAEASGWYNAAQAQLQKAFIAGAKWDREQMLKDTVEGLVAPIGFHNAIYIREPEFTALRDKLERGSKVKIIIVKED